MGNLKEICDASKGQRMLGRLQARNNSKQKGETDRDESLVVGLSESELRDIVRKSVSKILSESYNSHNELQRFAYENQGVRPMVQKLADFAETVAQIGKMQGKENYYQFYHKLHGDILQMNNLWGFLDDDD